MIGMRTIAQESQWGGSVASRGLAKISAVLTVMVCLFLQSCGTNSAIKLTISPLAVMTTSLLNGQVGTAYSSTLAASGGTLPYTWSLTAGTLPAGLSLSASGVISGTPTAAASATSLTFKVTDSSQPAQTNSATLSLTITGAAPVITTTSLPNGQVGTAYNTSLAASGGTLPYTWTLTAGTLPAGLSLSASGAISGTPTAAANATSLTFRVTDSSQPAQTNSATLSFTITGAAPVITTTSLPNGQVGTAYSSTLAASGGTLPYTWTLTVGTLPAGLGLSASGVISGTPTATASATSLTFKVTDSSQPAQTNSATLSLTITAAALVITTTSLPNGHVGTAYTSSLAASGGTPPYTWTLTAGTLPAGLSLSASGVISGTPTAAANGTSLTFKVTDSSQLAQTNSATLSLAITGTGPVITTASLPNGQVGTAYTSSLAASGGTSPYTWSLTAGTLPAGLSLSASGVIIGTPTAAASATSLTFKVTDSSQPAQTNSATLSLTVTGAAPVITTTSLPSGQVGTAYSSTLAASGGTLPYTWTQTAGTLPTGLGLSASGVISGTPTATASATSLTFKVTDSSQPAQTNSATLSLTITGAAPVITTTSLPSGQVGTAYSSSLAATGGTLPYTWTQTAGTLPAGLGLSASGVISGTPTATANATSLTFKVTDSSQPAQSKSATLSLTVTGAVSVSISPTRAGLTITQTLSLTGTASDGGAVNWSATGSNCSGASCGTFSSQSTASGSPVTYTAPGTAGQYTITATSVNDAAGTSSVTVGVTDLSGVATYHNNTARNGVNSQEYTLAPANVTASTFGKLFSCTVDGAIYTQPLWVPNLTIGGAKHNVVFVTTQHDSLYAFDADASPCTMLWHANLIDTPHGGTAGETSVPYSLLGAGNGDIQPEVGVTGTPVIDLGTDLLYVVSKSVDSTGTNFYQRLHAINLLTGSERLSTGPVVISATFPAMGGTATFSAKQENQRAGLALINGVVYIAWGSHEDTLPWYGWMIGYDPATLAQLYVFNTAPNFGQTSIWMAGGAPAADSSGNIYVITANGYFDATDSTPPNNDYGDSFLKLTNNLTVSQYFTPADQSNDNLVDNDFGSGGTAVVVDLPTNGSHPNHLVIGGGKDGYLCLLNRDSLGGYSATNSGAVQLLNLGSGIFGTPAYWNWSFYLAGIDGHLQQYTLNSSTYTINSSPTSSSATIYGFPGATPSISTKPDNSNAILWALDATQYCTHESPGCGPVVLHAYDATNLSTEFWNSSQGTGNAAGLPVKFTFPTVANGKVYVGTRGNDSQQSGTTATIPGELDVYGLLPN
jgi:hypothetical protein